MPESLTAYHDTDADVVSDLAALPGSTHPNVVIDIGRCHSC